ncbi:MAG: hypothetical protein HQL56_05635 [Magnetococcales bacterium]|nr:hypothetical protein [Magnetococcales bacterium]
MKILHLADLHISGKTIGDIERAFAFLLQEVVSRHIEACVIAGDTWDTATPLHDPCVGRAMELIKAMADRVPTLILQGTPGHDRPGSVDHFRRLTDSVFVATEPCVVGLCPKTAEYPGDWCALALDDTRLDQMEALFYCLPSPNPASKAVQDAGGIFNWAQEWLWKCPRAADTVPVVVVAHGSVAGSITETGRALLTDVEYTDAMLYGTDAGAIMLGHIHKHQVFTNHLGQRIAYPGSLIALHFGDEGPHGGIVWEMDSNRVVEMEHVPVPGPRYTDLVFDGPPEMAVIEEAARTMDANTRVRVRWQVDEEHQSAVDREAIQALLQGAGQVKLDGVINPVQRVRTPGIGAVSMADRVGRWADNTNSTDKLDVLLGNLTILESGSTVEEIVEGVLA